MSLPFEFPLAPMLAKLQTEIPQGEGWLYEPKWDGFRAIVFRDGDSVEICSRDLRPLQRYFPELLPTLCGSLPERCIVDGEIIVSTASGLDFDPLQLRLHPAESRVRKLAGEIPSSYVAFDLLALDDRDLRPEAFSERRTLLEQSIEGGQAETFNFLAAPSSGSRVYLTPQTSDAEEAARWFDDLEKIHLEGIVAKREEQPYSPGERTMVKIKHRRSVDCVVGGYRIDKNAIGLGSLLLGLYDNSGVLHYVGHTSSFSRREGQAVREKLAPLEGGESFGHGRSPGGVSRWTRPGTESNWVPVKPELVCEVSFDYLQGERFRHAARFERWRDDKPPRECLFDQLGVGDPTPIPEEWQGRTWHR
ncbi:MAG: ATP-dependent DNA ligase [Chloroflexi bacterium]|nr:ATP-dependent DNA ligase [Chloroflexota bacterium]